MSSTKSFHIKTFLSLIIVLGIVIVAFTKGYPLALPNRTERFPSPDGTRAIVLSVDHVKQSATFLCLRVSIVNNQGETEFQEQTPDPYDFMYRVRWKDDTEILYNGSKSGLIVWMSLQGAWRQVL